MYYMVQYYYCTTSINVVTYNIVDCILQYLFAKNSHLISHQSVTFPAGGKTHN